MEDQTDGTDSINWNNIGQEATFADILSEIKTKIHEEQEEIYS
jgi:hypothetical protein